MKRYGMIDSIRGLTLLSMIMYHACWDLVYLFGRPWQWYEGESAYIWQQSICWIFILLSGFCWSFGKKPLKRGLLVFGAGALVTLVTCLFMPEEKVLFGVLTCIGSCMLIMIIVEKGLRKCREIPGLIISFIFFFVTGNINSGYLGFEEWNFLRIPQNLYKGNLMTYIGFTDQSFFSTDYFSLFPWFFLFLTGYFVFRLLKRYLPSTAWDKYLTKEWKPLSVLGKKSLIIYILHQPIIYGVLLFMER